MRHLIAILTILLMATYSYEAYGQGKVTRPKKKSESSVNNRIRKSTKNVIIVSGKMNPSNSRYQAAKTQPETYTVKAGDSLSSIARMAGLTVTRLQQLNGLKSSDQLKVGQVLKIK